MVRSSTFQLGLFTLCAVIAASHLPCGADVQLPALFGSKMVLQREAQVAVWGWAEPGEKVSVSASWSPITMYTVAASDGKWSLMLATPAAGGPHTVTIAAGNTIVLDDVLTGEVWICSGQSNMEWTVGPGVGSGVDLWEEELEAAEHDKLRFFDVQNTVATQPAEDCSGQWQVCTPVNTQTFSATAYFFGRDLMQRLKVPVGLISTSWGGTPAEAWTSESALRRLGGFDAQLDELAQARANPEEGEDSLEDLQAAWWQDLATRDAGSKQDGYWRTEANTAAFKPVQLPMTWEQTDIGDFDGVVWFRREVELPAGWESAQLTLELGPIDDMDTTWFNGEVVGRTESDNHWQTPRSYAIPAGVARAGRNVVAVRVVDSGGAGGINGKPEDLRLTRAGGDESLPLAGDWQYSEGATIADLGAWPQRAKINQNFPTSLYNGMLAPIASFGMRGVIWYQGESNVSRAIQYATLFPTMIADWRSTFGHDFPFYYVQIAPFAYRNDVGQAAFLRDAQRLALRVPNTGMAVTMDIGDARDIHPRNKQDIGHRLARWALAKTYGDESIVCSGPLYRGYTIEDGEIKISFTHADGLQALDGPLTHFSIAAADRKFVPAEARIEGQKVIVRSDVVPEPLAVRYGWQAAAEPNLANGTGLPAASFRTDTWDPEF